MRIVIDTNILVSALLNPRGTPGLIYSRWREQFFQCIFTSEIIEELVEVLNRRKFAQLFSKEDVSALLDFINSYGCFTEVEPSTSPCIDPDDIKFLEAAEAGKAHYIVSGDVHLLDLREHQGIPIITATEFVSILERESFFDEVDAAYSELDQKQLRTEQEER